MKCIFWISCDLSENELKLLISLTSSWHIMMLGFLGPITMCCAFLRTGNGFNCLMIFVGLSILILGD